MSGIDSEVLVKALDERADRYMNAVADCFTLVSTARRDEVVEKARLLVRCHDMWLEAKEATTAEAAS